MTQPANQGQQSAKPKPDGAEILSRVIFGGFWAGVAFLIVVVSVVLLANQEVIGLLGLPLAVPFALYAVYIFRGGRWRFIIW